MLNQNFTPKEISKIIKKGDGKKYNLWSDPNKKNAEIEKYSETIINRHFKITHINKQERKGKPVFVIDSANGGVDYLALRKADKNIKKIYKVKQSDRTRIVSQLLAIIEDGSPMHILKLDIKSFYESISPEHLLDKLKLDQIVSKKTEMVIESLFQHSEIKKIGGLPRGISISATLSEIYMRDFDRTIKNTDGVYFYSRFVDDIIIVLYENKSQILDTISTKLEQKKLYLNPDKQDKVTLDGPINSKLGEINYLGYRFEIFRKKKKNCLFNKILVHIADSKIKKIKKRVILSFLDYFSNSNFPLLKDRLKFLTGNCSIDKNENGKLMIGNFYNYPLINELSCLKKLDIFLYSLLKGRNGYVGKKNNLNLTTAQINHLLHYSFLKGYKSNLGSPILFNFSRSKLIKITQCWQYE
jgi:hypothetical protein